MSRSASLTWLALPLIGFLASCSAGAGGEGREYAVRDSAGVRIVENSDPLRAADRGWAVSREPLVSIGEVDGRPEYHLAKVADAVRLSDGRIVVADEGSSSLRMYDRAGVHLRTMGGPGGGPGEYQWLTWLWKLPGDSLLAYDARPRRTTAYHPGGELIGTADLSIPPRGHLVRGRFADGTLLTTYVRPSLSSLSGPRRQPVDLLRVSVDGAALNPIATLAGDEDFMQVAEGPVNPVGGIAAVASPIYFGRSTRYAVSGDRLFAGDTDRSEIGVYAGDGTLERLIRWSSEPRSVSRSAVDSMKAAQLSRSLPETLALRRKLLSAMPVPETMPAFDRIVAGETGDLWVEEYRVPGSAPDARWTVFDREGRMLASVLLPDRFAPLEIGEDYVLGSWRDEMDVQFVHLYRLDRR